ncbi:hypothetical protein ACN6AT_00485 [Streptomyces sp. JL4002]|uniref:hypothetical protein n=1 Tax=Streptomyces sp. JL4002 TaxID=3404781 RepID=UPI003B27E892
MTATLPPNHLDQRHRGPRTGGTPRRLAAPRRNWARLNAEQQALLGEFGAGPQKAPQTRKAAAKAAASSGPAGGEAFQKGLQALAQYLAREGGGIPGRSHVERLPDGSEHRTGVWLANRRRRRDRLDQAWLGALAELDVVWAR